MRSLIVALTLAVALTGCMTIKGMFDSTPKMLVITGDSLNSLSVTAEKVSIHMTAQCVAKVYTVQTCTNYRLFGEKFKLAFPVAKSMWNTAAQYEDKGLAAAAESALAKLGADLAPFLALMGGK